MSRGSLLVKVAAVGLLVVGVFVVRATWEVLRPGEPGAVPVAQAQTDQYLAPSSQGSGTYVFTGSGAEDVTTELFDITGDQFTVRSESDPPGNQPSISITNENGDAIDAELDNDDDFNSDIYTAITSPGRYRLDILPQVANASYTVTVTDGGAGTAPQQDDNGDDSAQDQTAQDQTTTAAPAQQQYQSAPLLESGGSFAGPVPAMPGGGCPEEFPVARDGGCWGG
jgi:hypothetical protein